MLGRRGHASRRRLDPAELLDSMWTSSPVRAFVPDTGSSPSPEAPPDRVKIPETVESAYPAFGDLGGGEAQPRSFTIATARGGRFATTAAPKSDQQDQLALEPIAADPLPRQRT